MDEKLKALKKSAENPRPPLKFDKLTLLLTIGALGHLEFQSFRPQNLRDADFFKAEGIRIRK